MSFPRSTTLPRSRGGGIASDRSELLPRDANTPKAPYTIVIPPPNVTGSLHMGHALFATLQDILTRWRRMQGYNALWLPGTDHAGIATQLVVERRLWREEQKSRHDIGREAFLERVWQWKQRSGGRIIEQLKVMGASCDWQRERFTMDEGLSRAVREAFVRLYEEGLIYRARRLINWCPRCHSALSDLEVEHNETDGKLWHIAYPVGSGGDASWWPPPDPRPCSVTPRWPSTPRTSASATSSPARRAAAHRPHHPHHR